MAYGQPRSALLASHNCFEFRQLLHPLEIKDLNMPPSNQKSREKEGKSNFWNLRRSTKAMRSKRMMNKTKATSSLGLQMK